MKLFLLEILSLLLLAGCTVTKSYQGHAIDFDDCAKLKIGEAKKEDVIDRLGLPSQDKIASKEEELTYRYRYEVDREVGLPLPLVPDLVSISSSTSYTVVVVLDERGVVREIRRER